MAKNDKDRCIICDKTVTPKNSPSAFDSKDNPKYKSYPICDPCADRFGKGKDKK